MNKCNYNLGEDENGMTVHEKLDYIMKNGVSSNIITKTISICSGTTDNSFIVDMTEYTSESLLNFNIHFIPTYIGTTGYADNDRLADLTCTVSSDTSVTINYNVCSSGRNCFLTIKGYFILIKK